MHLTSSSVKQVLVHLLRLGLSVSTRGLSTSFLCLENHTCFAQPRPRGAEAMSRASCSPAGRRVLRTQQGLSFSLALFLQTCQPVGASESPLGRKGLQSLPRAGRSAHPDTAVIFNAVPLVNSFSSQINHVTVGSPSSSI